MGIIYCCVQNSHRLGSGGLYSPCLCASVQLSSREAWTILPSRVSSCNLRLMSIWRVEIAAAYDKVM
jgi:hypothetical protein